MKTTAESFLLSKEDLTSFKKEWNDLLQRSESDNIFLTWEWVSSWVEAYGENLTLSIVVIKKEEKVIGIAPLYHDGTTLSFCSGNDLYPDYLDFIIDKNESQTALDHIFRFLYENFGFLPQWKFDHALEGSCIKKGIEEHKQSRDLLLQKTSQSFSIRSFPSMENYLSEKFKKKKRYNIKRQVRIALEEKKLAHKIVKRDDFSEQAIGDFLSLHEKRAGSKNIKSSILSDNAKTFFYKFSRKINESGYLNLQFLEYEEKPVSVVYSLIYGDKNYYFQSGADPEWEKWSVGTVLLTKLIENSFEAGLKEFDFLKGDEEYKKSWATDSQDEYCYALYSKSLSGRTAYFLKKLKMALKSLMGKQ